MKSRWNAQVLVPSLDVGTPGGRYRCAALCLLVDEVMINWWASWRNAGIEPMIQNDLWIQSHANMPYGSSRTFLGSGTGEIIYYRLEG